MKNLSMRPIQDPVNAFAIEREIREIKSLLQRLPIFFGNGSPEGNEIAAIGSLFLRLDGGTSTTLYVKESGEGTATGWVAK